MKTFHVLGYIVLIIKKPVKKKLRKYQWLVIDIKILQGKTIPAIKEYRALTNPLCEGSWIRESKEAVDQRKNYLCNKGYFRSVETSMYRFEITFEGKRYLKKLEHRYLKRLYLKQRLELI